MQLECWNIDDILVTGATQEEHLRTLEEVLRRLEKAGARLKREKCQFMLPMVEYLGHRISADGLQPTDSKIKALKDAPIPSNVSQLKAFLGLLNYYGKFVPKLSTLLAPLHRLLQKTATWTWGPDQQQAFDRVKEVLTSDRVLAHYDPSLPLILACDASPYGVGAVLSHRPRCQRRNAGVLFEEILEGLMVREYGKVSANQVLVETSNTKNNG